jgi:hypothetical protein
LPWTATAVTAIWQTAPADRKKYFDSIPSPMIALSLIAHGLYHFVFYVFWHDII